jgi:hypothetical protein
MTNDFPEPVLQIVKLNIIFSAESSKPVVDHDFLVSLVHFLNSLGSGATKH